MTRKKLLYLVTEDWYFVSHRLALAEAARDSGYEVSVVTNVTKHGDLIRNAGLNLIPIDFDRSGLNPLRDSATIAKLTAIYRREKPDVVHHVAMKPVLYGSIAARVAHVPCVVNAIMGLGYVFTSGSRKAKVLRPAVRAALRAALSSTQSRVIVQNRDDREHLIKSRLAEPGSIRLIRGSGVDLADFKITPPPAGRPRIVLPARLLRDKGVFEFIEAARLLKRDGVDAEFVLAGAPDPLNPGSLTKSEIDAYEREGLVTALGLRDDMAAVFANAMIVCLPSYREGLPKALLEAAASGRPIVTTDVPGCREIVEHDVNGLLVPARNAHALAAALHRLIADPVLRGRLAAAGRAHVEAEFTLPRIIAETLAVYGELQLTSP